MLTLYVNAVNTILFHMAKTSRSARKAYHHGSLRETLVEKAVELLRKEGFEALTLRGVARAAEVSQAAPYRHFADRRALLGAVAENGFARLGQEMMAAVQEGQGRAGFKGFAVAYVKFAMANPAQYRLMFGPEVANHSDLPSLQQASHGVLGFVAEGVRRLQGAGLVREGDPWSMAVGLWATLHGLVMIYLDGISEGVAPPLPELLDEAMRMMMFGMAPRPDTV
jgi:AcrR family transcriptional regulator